MSSLPLDSPPATTACNEAVYRSTGRLLEKYNVEEIGLFAEGGEYDVQDGVGWTNGVLLSLLNELEVE